MKGSSPPDVRLVRCPRCREVLPEPVDVPFYKCGGCDTILQAKHYKKANEKKNLVSEGSGSVHNNEAEYGAQGGEARSSISPLLMDPNEGNSAENGTLEPPGASNYSGEASSTSQPKQQLPSSCAQRFLDLNEESELNLEVTKTLKEHSSLNEPSSPSHEVSSNLGPETGEVEGDHRSVEQHGDSIASSSDDSMEQLAQLVLEKAKVRQNEIVVEERLIAVDSCSATTAKTDGEADELNQNVGINCRLEQPGVMKYPSEAFLSNEPSLHQTSNSSQVASEEGQVEGSCSKLKDQPELSNFSSDPFLSIEDAAGGDELPSQLGSPNEDVMMTEQQFVADGYSNTVTSSNKSTFHENKELDESFSPPEVNSKLLDESEILLPESAKTSALIISLSSEVSTAPDEYGNRELQYPGEVDATADGNKSACALPTSSPTAEAEVLSLDDRSQKTVEITPREKIKEGKATETTEVVDTSCRDLSKSPTRSSFAYDGSVSSYDGNDDQIMHQLPSGTMQGIKKTENSVADDRKQYHSGRSTTSSGSAYQHKMDNIHAVSPGEDLHPEEQRIPVMLNEIKMPEVLSDVPYRRNRMRPRTQEFLPKVPLHKRSPEVPYDSSGHLIHKELYDHPRYYPPYQYRDVESRVTRGHLHSSDMDGRMISESVWMGEEFHMYPYRESSIEMYPFPRHPMNYRGRRQTEYLPLVHGLARVPYSGEAVRSGYRVVDSYSHLYPSDMRWSGVSYGRGWHGPREPYDSYTASPAYFSDSDYYARSSHDTISEDQRYTNQRMRRNTEPVQHFQPIGGAAPFIICHQCSELLQLPSDFLVFKGIRLHRVKCSACSSILKFTLEKGCHLVPYVPKPKAPPLTEKGDKPVKSASTSQPIHDYEAMYRRSASASIYAAAAGNSQAHNDQKVSLRSTSQAVERPHFQDKGKSVMVELHNKHNNNAQGSSSPDIPRNAKVTWKLPDRSNSPLHRLMGYSSPSAVLYGYGSDDFEMQNKRRSDI